MGLTLSSWLDSFVNHFYKPTSIIILGLDNAGKTQILYCMKLGQSISNTIPTLGFNIEEISYKNLTFKAWDIGGQSAYRQMWHHFYDDADAVIFVLDSQDRDRFKEAKQELHALLNQEKLRELPFLIFANKQDLPNAAEITELKKVLELHKWNYKNNIKIVACTALDNHRITTGMDWLAGTI